jgi:hypothetical protein
MIIQNRELNVKYLRSNLRTLIAELRGGIVGLKGHARWVASEQFAMLERANSLNPIQLYVLLARCSVCQRSAFNCTRVSRGQQKQLTYGP